MADSYKEVTLNEKSLLLTTPIRSIEAITQQVCF